MIEYEYLMFDFMENWLKKKEKKKFYSKKYENDVNLLLASMVAKSTFQ